MHNPINNRTLNLATESSITYFKNPVNSYFMDVQFAFAFYR